MIAAVGLPLALLLGLVADLMAGGLERVLGRERRWWGRLTDRWDEVRRLWGKRRAGERASVLEAAGAAAALLGAGIVAAASIGQIPGTLPLVYLGLLGATGGSHLAASTSAARAGARLRAVLVEPAFVTALGAAFLRWGASDLEGISGAQEILGPGIAVGPPLALAGLVVSAAVILVAGALRSPSVRREQPAASSFLMAVSRWAAVGATGLVVVSLVAGPVPGSAADVAAPASAAIGCALVLGGTGALAGSLRGRARAGALVVLTLLAAAAAVLVAVA
jgi:hypothetical protein